MSETRVWIAQCLCPDRHAILAASGEADSEPAAMSTIAWPLREAIEAALHTGVLNPWCGLCKAGSETWRYEVGRTRYRTMAEAENPLRENEAKQAATRAAFGDMKRSD